MFIVFGGFKGSNDFFLDAKQATAAGRALCRSQRPAPAETNCVRKKVAKTSAWEVAALTSHITRLTAQPITSVLRSVFWSMHLKNGRNNRAKTGLPKTKFHFFVVAKARKGTDFDGILPVVLFGFGHSKSRRATAGFGSKSKSECFRPGFLDDFGRPGFLSPWYVY